MSDNKKMELHVNGKHFCDIEKVTDPVLVAQKFQFGSSQPIESRKVVRVFTSVEPVVAMGRQHSIVAGDIRMLIDITQVQVADGSFQSLASLLGLEK